MKPKFEIKMDKLNKKMFLETDDKEWNYPNRRNCHAFYWSTQIQMTLQGVLVTITPWNEELRSNLSKQVAIIFKQAISKGDLFQDDNSLWTWRPEQ